MITLKDAKAIADKELIRFGFTRDPVSLYEPIGYILSLGGKRLRPSLTLMAASIFGKGPEHAVPAACAIEVFHNFTLLHDDIMDQAPMRRGHPTVQVKWNTNTAILSGDAMLIEAFRILHGTRPDILPAVTEIFTQTALEVCEGQQYDMDYEKRDVISESEYLRMIELKTAVLIAASMKIGAICGGSDTREAELLYEAGRNIGLAFQLQDDLLDTYGDPEVFGKAIGGDILANKKTYLFVMASERSADSERKELLRLYSVTDMESETKISKVKGIFDACHTESITMDKIEYYLQQAKICFDALLTSEENRIQFSGLLDHLLGRKA